MEINGHKLPDELYELIKDKERDELPFIGMASLQYLVPSDVKVTGGFFGGMRLNNVEDIKRDTYWEHILDIGDAYSIASSKFSKKAITDLHILDVDKSLNIAGNHDEEIIALDYRVNPLDPRVLGSFHPPQWVLLANSFAEFMKKIKL